MFSQVSKWISADKEYNAPIFIKKFTLSNVEKASIDICGLGYYELFINGKRVGEEYFKPVVSDYADRDFSAWLYPTQDKTSHSVYYNTYSVKKYIKEGENTLAVLLGNGFYRQIERTAEGDTRFGDELVLRYELRVRSGGNVTTIASDGREKVAHSFIKNNNIFFGETHDYTDFDETFFAGKSIENLPFAHTRVALNAKIRRQNCPNDTIMKTFLPKCILKTEKGAIYDVGENISGFVRLRPLGDKVTVRHAENIKENALDFDSAGGSKQIYQNTYKNAIGKIVQPWFSWGGFRYFEIEGNAEILDACFVHTNVETTAKFECGNENINWLFQAYLRTQKGNLHGGVPSDCPHRERLGYTGDGQVTAESAALCFNMQKFYQKWIQDIADCQDQRNGHVQHTAPFFGGGGGPGGWGSAIVNVPYACYKVYDDKQILKKYFKNMIAYIKSMQGFCEHGLVVKEREKGWCLGDWCTPEPIEIPEPFVNTFYYIRCMERVEEIARLLGKKVEYSQEIAQSKRAIAFEYFDVNTGDFCAGKQGANAFALLLGLGDIRTKENILSHYKQRKTFDTGIFGTDIVCEYLVKIGEIQLLYDLLSAENYPSFGNMRNHGATTLWEWWDGSGSHNHPMFGGCVKQLFYGLLGLQFDDGLENIRINPTYIDGIRFIRAQLKLGGKILRFEYHYQDGKVYTETNF